MGLSLTPRQRQIVTLLAQGRSQQAVAAELGISIQTVKNHLSEARAANSHETTVALVIDFVNGGPNAGIGDLTRRVEALEAMHGAHDHAG